MRNNPRGVTKVDKEPKKGKEPGDEESGPPLTATLKDIAECE